MAMRSDFAVFILTHGRPDRVLTYDTLIKAGYTGKIYIVIDDEDKTAEQYRARFGDKVIQFCKREVAERFDEGDNFQNRKAIFYARNVCFDLARQVSARYFIQLDDDYSGLYIRFARDGRYVSARIKSTVDSLLSSCVDVLIATAARTICISQGGDHIGGDDGGAIRATRKAMNTFVCDVDRPFEFVGRVNEDVNTYTAGGRSGDLFLTFRHAQVNQLQTQSNAGGMTDLYLESGTYVKSFYSVMYCPSAVKVGTLGDPRSPHRRLHHDINWNHCAAKILRESNRKSREASP
jgi:hypothetical protein